ncbi:MAG: TonB-dependent receptor [Bacteroidota bacterium]
MKRPGLYILVVILFLLTDSLFAQENLLKKRISLNFRQKPATEVLSYISNEYNIQFMYSNNLISDSLLVSVRAKRKTLDIVLWQMFRNYPVTFSVVENQVVLCRKETGTNTGDMQKKRYTVSGFVRDMQTGENLMGTSVYIKEFQAGTISNEYGFYSLTLPEGHYTLVFSFIGFSDVVVPVELNKNLNITTAMEFNEQFISEIVVEANNSESEIEQNQTSEARLDPKTLQEIPAFLGETEVIKSLQSQPGIKSYGDGSTFFYVRGGDRDQNLILIDEAPVYNPSHLLGLFSAFVPEAILDVHLYKGDFPARFGGRLSSVLDIRTREGNLHGFDGNLGLGLFISRFSLNGPIIKDKSSFFVSFRKSNLEYLFRSENPDQRLYFFDLNYKFNIKVSEHNRIYFSGYNGQDYFRKFGTDMGTFGLSWKNSANTLRWNHIFNERLFSNTTFIASKYDYLLIISEEDNYYWTSSIGNLSGKTDFTWYLNPDLTTRFGLGYTYHSFNPGELVMAVDLTELGYPETFKKYTSETFFYYENEQKFLKKLSLRYGFRISLWDNLGPGTEYILNEVHFPTDTIVYPKGESYHRYFSIEPRACLNYTITKKASLKASYNRTSQHLQILSNSISPFTSLEVWVPSSPSIRPQEADQFVLGYFRKFSKWATDFSAEAFFKRMTHQIDYEDHANMLLNPVIETELRFGNAWSYGLEFMYRKEYGKCRGWVSYTWSRAFKKTLEINDGIAYPVFYDRPHDFSIYLSRDLSKRWIIAASWIYTTGSAISIPTGFYFYQGYSIPIYGEKNNGRLPDYHRMDLMITMDLNPKGKKDFNHCLILTLYNLYGRKNYISMNYNKVRFDDGTIGIPSDRENPYEYIPTSIYLHTIVPSLSYNLKF